MSEGYVRVAVPLPVRQGFTYRLPEGLAARPGCRVRVRVGSRRLVGMVVAGPAPEPGSEVPAERIRDVEELLDAEPLLPPELLSLCGWMASYYHLAPGEAYLLPLPPSLTGGRKGHAPRRTIYRRERVVRWAREPEEGERLGMRMDAALSWLRTVGEAAERDVRQATGVGPDVVRRLQRRELVAVRERRVLRDPFAGMPPLEEPRPEPTGAQRRVLDGIRSTLGSYQGHLLLGVTGSGKTEVYLRLIREVLDRGESALVLVPEIALTPQLVGRFRARLGDRIAALHSAMDEAVRHEQWARVREGELRVVIGARSALFAPIHRPGLIVVDEEHDASFKQETAPRYHGRDLALVRGWLAGCPVVLGTATPSVESWANVQRGKLSLHLLSERVEKRPLPSVDRVDMRRIATADAEGVLSEPLVEALRANLERGEQALLLLNRRGFASFVLCRACGEPLSCPACAVSYTWHRRRARLVCHYCDRVAAHPDRCPDCGDAHLEEIGVGTERVEDLLRTHVPGARVARMDRDTTRGRALPELLDRFRRRELDVLVGTQMIAKGHDFPAVTLVGVLLAETGLNIPDFRAAERTFQLVTQVAGRAGRADRPGRVLVQSHLPEHYALRKAAGTDPRPFLDEELELRRERDFPPWAQLALVRLAGRSYEATWEEACRCGDWLRARARAMEPAAERPVVLGPQAAPLERLREQWRFQLLLRSPVRRTLAHLLEGFAADLEATRRPRGVQLGLDVDPQSFV